MQFFTKAKRICISSFKNDKRQYDTRMSRSFVANDNSASDVWRMICRRIQDRT